MGDARPGFFAITFKIPFLNNLETKKYFFFQWLYGFFVCILGHLIDEFVASSKDQPPLDTNQFTEEEPDSSNTNHIEKNSLGDNDFKSNNFPESIIGNNQNSSDNQEINTKAVTFGQDDFMINGKCDTSDTMFSSENTHKERVIQEDTFVGVACDSMPEMSDVKNSDNNFKTSLTNSNALVSTSEPNNGCDKNCTDESEVIIPNTTNNNIIDMQSKMKTEEICNGGITNLDKVAKIQIHGPCEDSFAVETNTDVCFKSELPVEPLKVEPDESLSVKREFEESFNAEISSTTPSFEALTNIEETPTFPEPDKVGPAIVVESVPENLSSKEVPKNTIPEREDDLLAPPAKKRKTCSMFVDNLDQHLLDGKKGIDLLQAIEDQSNKHISTHKSSSAESASSVAESTGSPRKGSSYTIDSSNLVGADNNHSDIKHEKNNFSDSKEGLKSDVKSQKSKDVSHRRHSSSSSGRKHDSKSSRSSSGRKHSSSSSRRRDSRARLMTNGNYSYAPEDVSFKFF